jgi:protease-4
MSPAAREALDGLLDDTFRVLVDSLSTGRGLAPDSIRALIDQGPFSAREARRAGLADTLAYEEQIDSLAVRRAGHGVEAVTLAHHDAAQRPRWGARIAYVSASGEITSGRSRTQPDGTEVIGSETLVKALRDVRERRSIKAVVLRIDSPGGEMGASDDIWHEVRRLNAVKPVIVSMSDLGASGGYYIAAPATKIVAQPGTITGSIGVFGGKLNVLGLYQKLGLNVETVSRGRHAGLMSPFRDFTPEEAERFQAHIDESYRLFLERVANGRHLTTDAVDAVARGRVWSGRSARSRALVDSLGGIRLAFQLAVHSAGLPEDSPFAMEEYPRVEQSFFERMLQGWLEDESDDSGEASTRVLPDAIRAWMAMALLPAGRPLAVMPWSIRIR